MDAAATPPSPAETHFARLASLVPVAGRKILDIGCGSGAFLKQLLAGGADATGMEVTQETLNRAAAAGIDRKRLALGDGRTLPFADGSFDCACFVFSFHHVPAGLQTAVLAEAARVLAPDGTLIAIEPLPTGPMSEVLAPIEDETEVRTRSQALLAAPPAPFVLEETVSYEIARIHASHDAMIRDAVEVDAARAERARQPEVVAAVADRFARVSTSVDGGFELRQPCTLYRFCKR
ncbi:SAM-dependent methyltransferase [Amorphus suaedae]